MGYVSEDKAKTKWCPFSMIANGTLKAPSFNRTDRDGDVPTGAKCIGTACMMFLEVKSVNDSLHSPKHKGYQCGMSK